MGYYYRFLLECIRTQYTTRERSFFEILIAKCFATGKINEAEFNLLMAELDIWYGAGTSTMQATALDLYNSKTITSAGMDILVKALAKTEAGTVEAR